MVYVIILSVIVGTLGIYYFILKNMNFFKKHKIPYITPLPILGNMGPTIFRRKSFAEIIKELYDAHPEAKYVGMYDFSEPVTVLRDPELIKSIALKHFDMFMNHRNVITENQDPLIAKNLFLVNGERWRESRSLLSPTFTSSKMRNMFKLMSDCAVEFTNFMAQMPSEKRMIEIRDSFTRYTNDVIATCAFGVSVDSMRNPKNQFYVYGREATNFRGVTILKFYMYRILPWLAEILKIRLIRDDIANFFKDLVETTIKTRDEKGIVRPDMLQLMMENRSEKGRTKLDIEDIVGHAFTFFFAGFDGPARAMCFVAHELAVNFNVQGRLQNEIDQVLEDTNGQAFYEAIMSMEYLDAVINETLRMYPILAGTDRVCLKDFQLPPTLPGTEPFTIRKGQTIMIPIYGLQHDAKYFKKPDKFDPERFLGDRKKDSLNCGAYFPFGVGPRMCIGNRFALVEIKVLFFHLLARCDLKICEKTCVPIKIAKDDLNLGAEDGFWLSVVPRKNPHYTVATNVNETHNP